jgi:transposase
MMSDYSKPIPSMPKETARAANAIFGRSNFYIVIGEYLEVILENIEFQDLSEKEDAPKLEWVICALITFFQFVEGLTDAQAVDAIRTRIDWKFALHLSLIPATFYEGTLCKFRQRMLIDPASQSEFQKFVDRLITFVPSFQKNFHNLKSLEVVATVCSLNRLSHAQQAMNQTLEILAVKFPDWLRKITLPHWYGRYSPATSRLDVAILLGQQRFLMEEIGTDIHHLLEKIQQSGLQDLAEIYEVKTLDQVWLQQFKGPHSGSNSWPENLNLKDCNTCTLRWSGRRH